MFIKYSFNIVFMMVIIIVGDEDDGYVYPPKLA